MSECDCKRVQKSRFLHELNKKKKEGKKGGKGRKKGKMTILNGCLGYMPTPAGVPRTRPFNDYGLYGDA